MNTRPNTAAIFTFILGVTIAIAGPSFADLVRGDIVVFGDGETLTATELNNNFDVLATAVEELEARATSCEADLSMVTQQLSSHQEVLQYFRRIDGRTYDTIRITGANLEITNGDLEGTEPNGVGNLVLGYDRNTRNNMLSHSLIVGDDTNNCVGMEQVIFDDSQRSQHSCL